MAGRLRTELRAVEELLSLVAPLRERFDGAIPPSALVPTTVGRYLADAPIDPKAQGWLDADGAIIDLEAALLTVAEALETRIGRSEKRRKVPPAPPHADSGG